MRRSHFVIYTFLIILFSTPFVGAQISKSDGYKMIGKGDSVVNRSHTVMPLHSKNMRQRDSIAVDSIPSDSVHKKKQNLDAPVDYSSNDSTVFLFANGHQGYLYGDADVKYKEISLKAENIDMNMDSSLVHATYGLDSTRQEFGYPVFTESGTDYEAKGIRYNFKTKKGYISEVRTQQGEGFLNAARSKKNADNSFFMADGKYTTCDDLDHPHFYMMLTKAKVRPKKNVVTGPAYLVVEDLPLPLAIPFGFFPFTNKYSSGIIMPSYGDDLDRGFSLRNGGYYFAINDYIDLALTGEIYTKGSWGLNAKSSYKKRYRYSGSFNLGYLVTKMGDKDVPSSYSLSKDFNFSWNHSQDAKANMYRTLSASVSYSSTSYNRNQLNTLYSPTATENTKNSTVSLTQRFPNSPFTLTASMSAAQRTQDSTVSLTLPSFTIGMSRIYPFKRKEAVGPERWYEKINLNYTGDLRNGITTKQSKLFSSGIKDWFTGMKHTVPVSATFNFFNYLNVSPSFTYTERWYTKGVDQAYLNGQNVNVDTINGFKRVYDYNYAISFQTKLYGMYTPLIGGNKLKAIRHVFTPSISFSAHPDFGSERYGYYKSYYYYDSYGDKKLYTYSPYQGEAFGVPSSGKEGALNFDFQNNIEAKIAAGDSTRIISLIDNLGIGFSYNMMADSMKLSDINTNIRLKLTKNLTVNIQGVFDPYTYKLDENGNPYKSNELRIHKYGTIGRLKSTSYSISPSINQDTFSKWFGKKDKDKDKTKTSDAQADAATTPDDAKKPKKSMFEKDKSAEGNFDSDGYMKDGFKWSLSANFGMSYGYGSFNYDKLEYNGKFTYNFGINGSIQPTKNWNFTFNSSYDFEANKFAYMNCTLSRNLHCWTLSASFIPVGPYTSYYISLRASSQLLQDLKYEQRGQPSSYDPQWY